MKSKEEEEKKQKFLPKYKVEYSENYQKYINALYEQNKGNNELNQIHDDIDGIIGHLQNPSMAWDNQGDKSTHTHNDDIHQFSEFGYTFTYEIIYNEKEKCNIIVIYGISMNFKEKGLKKPVIAIPIDVSNENHIYKSLLDFIKEHSTSTTIRSSISLEDYITKHISKHIV